MSRLIKLAAGYQLIEPIGVGGMGKVYLAQREGSPELCVLKRLLSDLPQHKNLLARFQREAQIASLLDHPSIAKTIDAGYDEDAFYIAMEFIAGTDLHEITTELFRRDEKVPVEFAVSVVMRALAGLAHAHQARGPDGEPLQIVHRDLSPKNVMVTFDGQVKLIDFGVARANLGGFRTESGMMVGTLRYFSPEQARGRNVDHRSDLYTLSIVLHEMLTGRVLVEEGGLISTVKRIVRRPAPPIRDLRPAVPERLAQVIERGLAKSASDRWGSAAEYLDALATATRGAVLADDAIAQLVKSWMPDEEKRTRERIEEGVRRYGASRGDNTELYEKTQAVTQFTEAGKTVSSERGDARPSPAPKPKWGLVKRLALIGVLTANAAMLIAAIAVQRKPAPQPETIAILPRETPVIVPREAAPEVAVEEVPPKIDPPVEAPKAAPKARALRRAPAADLDGALRARGLVRDDLEHQHALDDLVRRIRAGDDVATGELLERLGEVHFEGDRLKARLDRISVLLKRTEPLLTEREFRELERRFLIAVEGISSVLPHDRYRELCSGIDSLEHDVNAALKR